MKCPSCQFDNAEDSKFCLECGNKLEITCPQCGKALPMLAKFCNECGHNLIQSSEHPPKELSFYAELFKRQGDQPKAKENLSKAIEIFKECGADGWVEKYEKELVALS